MNINRSACVKKWKLDSLKAQKNTQGNICYDNLNFKWDTAFNVL